MKLIRYGTFYGGFWLPEKLENYLDKNSIIYLIGAGEDISFDCIISGKFNSKVYIFDPTPRSITHIDKVKNVLDTKKKPTFNKNIGGGDKDYWNIILKSNCKSENLKFYDLGISTSNSKVKFYKPMNPNYVSHSILSIGRSKDYIEVEVRNIRTLMEINGHSHIDFLKLDIENIECDVLEDLIKEKILPKVLCVDFDLARRGKSGKQRVDNMIKNLINNYNYQVLKNTEYDVSFLRSI